MDIYFYNTLTRNKEEFKRLVMEEIKKQLKINNESTNIFSEIEFV